MKDAPNLQLSPRPFNGLFSVSPCLSSTGEPAQQQTQNSTCAFTKAGLRGKITSINLLTSSFPVQPWRLLCDLCLCLPPLCHVSMLSQGLLTPRVFPAKLHSSRLATSTGGAWSYSCLGLHSLLPLADLALFDTTALPMHWAKLGWWVWNVLRVQREEMRYERYFTGHSSTIPVLKINSLPFLYRTRKINTRDQKF